MNLLRLSISPLPISTAWYALPLRLIIGFGFMQHGYAKLARGPEDFANVLHAMGLPVPFILGWATIIVELVGGLMILIGALIPLVTVPMAIVLLVAIFTVHLPNGFSSIKLQSFDAAGAHFGQPGYETDLLYLAGLAALCLGGPGPISIDGLLNRLTTFGAAAAVAPRMTISALALMQNAPDEIRRIIRGFDVPKSKHNFQRMNGPHTEKTHASTGTV